MDETKFAQLLDSLSGLTPDQYQHIFQALEQHFRQWEENPAIVNPKAVAWRCKQASMLLKVRNPIPV
jgi:hypothetical protein